MSANMETWTGGTPKQTAQRCCAALDHNQELGSSHETETEPVIVA